MSQIKLNPTTSIETFAYLIVDFFTFFCLKLLFIYTNLN